MPASRPKSLPHVRSAHLSWAKTLDRSARTAKAREAAEARFLDQADGDPKRAESLRKAWYAEIALKSAQARARRRQVQVNDIVRETEPTARQELIAALIRELDGGGDHAA